MLSALDGRGTGLQAKSFSKKPCGEANHRHSCTSLKQPLPEPLRGGSSKSSRQFPTEENCDDHSGVSVEEAEHCRAESTPSFFSEQAQFLSDLFSQPWKRAYCPAKESNVMVQKHQLISRLADWA